MRALICTGLLAFVGCGGDDFTNADFVGAWEVAVPAESGCWPAFTIRFDVEPDDAEVSEGSGVLNMVSVWWFPADPDNPHPFSGHFSEDDFAFVFGPGTGLRMEGGAGSSRQVTGTLVDRDGAISDAGCSATATASKL